jgi:hypothetical protein
MLNVLITAALLAATPFAMILAVLAITTLADWLMGVFPPPVTHVDLSVREPIRLEPQPVEVAGRLYHLHAQPAGELLPYRDDPVKQARRTANASTLDPVA